MANITKQKRDQMLEFLEKLKKEHSDDESVRAFNEIENHLKDKKFGLVFEEHTEEVDDMLVENIPILCADTERRVCRNSTKPWNFIIEGDNLQALYLLEKTHRGRVDCIYIDPPYNNRNRSWKYNNDYVDDKDTYKHSKWLSFMKTRLLLARKLLNADNSVLIVTIDEKEYLHLGCLLEEMFPEASIQMITSVISAKGVVRVGQFSRVEEYIFYVCFGKAAITQARINMLDDEVKKEEHRPIEWLGLRRREPSSKRGARPNQFYPIYVDENTGVIKEIGDALSDDIERNSVSVPDGCIAIWPLDSHGVETLWGLTPEVLRGNLKNGYVRIKNWNKNRKTGTVYYLPTGTIKDIETGKAKVSGYSDERYIEAYYEEEGLVPPKRVWNMKSHNAETYGTNILSKILPDRSFPYPKSLYAVMDCLKFAIGNKKDAIVIDFFAGSGTTMHAVNLLNKIDGGNRICISATNNEMGEDEEKALRKKGYCEDDIEWKNRGIARYINWPRTLCSIEGRDINGNTLEGNYGAEAENYVKKEGTGHRSCYGKKKYQIYPELENISYGDGFEANVSYMVCDWTPRMPEDYLLSNVLCLHIREMIELQNSIEIDGEKNVLILNKDDIKTKILDKDKYELIERIWLNQNIILNAEEMKLLREKGFRYIPREYFGQELREAAE